MDDINIIHCGDNRIVLTKYPDNFFDAFLEDVPYGLIGKDIPINAILHEKYKRLF